jgi:hypothetical protein
MKSGYELNMTYPITCVVVDEEEDFSADLIGFNCLWFGCRIDVFSSNLTVSCNWVVIVSLLSVIFVLEISHLEQSDFVKSIQKSLPPPIRCCRSSSALRVAGQSQLEDEARALNNLTACFQKLQILFNFI